MLEKRTRLYKFGQNRYDKPLTFMKKPFLLLLVIFTANITFAQHNKIVKLLNRQFEKEQKMYDEDVSDKPKLIQPFQIKNDSLSFEFTMPYYNDENKKEFTRRVVHLKEIQGFIKDMNVLFIAKEGSVKEIVTVKDNRGKVVSRQEYQTHLFFTEFRKDYKDKPLQKKMIKAFRNLGYSISSEYWH